jgi:hypothetical protein
LPSKRPSGAVGIRLAVAAGIVSVVMSHPSFTFLDKTCFRARIIAEQQDVLFSLTLEEAFVSTLDF